jgi:signal transduction histidine kinase
MSVALRVLFVEDSEDDVALQLRELRRGGFEPVHLRVEDEPSFRQALAGGGWELILADYTMPRFTGLAALALLLQSGQDVPFILISGTVGEEVAVECMKAGASDYVLKQSLARLVPAVRRELREVAGRRQRRQAEAALRESQALLALVYSHTSEMLVLASRPPAGGDYVVASVNRAMEEFGRRLGVDLGEAGWRGRELGEFLRALLGDEAADLRTRLDEALAGGRTISFEKELLLARGGFCTEQSFVPVPGPHGARHLLWASRDISERKRAEEKQRRLEAHLGQVQKLEALGALAGGIAHDFNNILAGIAGHLELIRADTQALSRVQENIDQIFQAVQRATDLIRRILTFSRQRPAARQAIPLGPVVREALQLLQPLIPRGIAVGVAEAPGCPTVLADPGQVHQVLVNLCTNAVQAMGTEGRLEVRLAPVELGAEFARANPPLRPGGHLRLTVSDTGCGMEERTLERIFEPFFTTKEHGTGTGLGLAVVHGVVRNHDGAVVVSSTPGRGTVFELYFPTATSAPHEQPGRAAPTEGHGEHILFVDDEPFLASLGESLLSRLGYRVSSFANPHLALERFRDDPAGFAVLVTDLTMPAMRGTELAAEVRRTRPDLPVILMSGFSRPEEESRIQEAGFGALLHKPFKVEEIADLLRRVLAR